MFSAHCKHCGTVVLLGPADVRSIHNTSTGIVLYFRCNAGHSGVWVTGRRSPSRTGASGQVAARQGAEPPLATPSGPSGFPDSRHSWWRRATRRRPLRSHPGAAPRHGWLRVG